MAGFDNDVVFGSNVDFSGNANVSAQVTLDGQLLIGSTASPNIRVGTLTAGPGVTITNGAGAITIGVTSGGVVLETLTGNTGGTVSPTANNINTVGSGSITIAGSGSTLTTQLTGLTNHAVLVGAGTSTITKLALATNGQVLLGSTGADPVFGTLTGTGGITFTVGAGSLVINGTGGGFTWTDITGATQTIAVANGYVTNRGGGVTYTLPATATEGDMFRIAGKLGAWSIAQNANQQILFGSSSSTVGVTGSIASTNVGDCAEVLCITSGASTIWRILSAVGNLTVA